MTSAHVATPQPGSAGKAKPFRYPTSMPLTFPTTRLRIMALIALAALLGACAEAASSPSAKAQPNPTSEATISQAGTTGGFPADSIPPGLTVAPINLPYGAYVQLGPGTYTAGAPEPLTTGAPRPLQFELLDDGWSGVRNSYRAEIGRDDTNGAVIAMWWRFGGVKATLCGEGPERGSPDPATAYRLLRAIPELSVSPESMTTFAGHQARFVDATVQPTIPSACVSRAAACCSGPVSFVLTGAGRGSEAAHLVMPLHGKMRLELVDISTQPLLVAIVTMAGDRFDRALANIQPTLESFKDAP
jgi:hypothetical protein